MKVPVGGHARAGRTPSVRSCGIAMVAALTMGLVTGCSDDPGGGTAGAADSELTEVDIVTLAGSFVSLPIAVADAEGYFQENGIEPVFVNTTAGTTAAAALVSGSADMGLLAAPEGLIAISQDQDLQWIAGLTTSYLADLVGATAADLPNRDAGYPEAVHDLEGMRIGVTAIGAASYYALLSVLDGAGLGEDDVTIIASGGNPASVAAIQAGELDAAILTDPLTHQVNEQEIATTLMSFYEGERPEIFESNLLNGFAATKEYIDANPELVEGANAAITQAHDLLASFDSPEDALPLAEKLQDAFEGTPPEDLAELIFNDRAAWTPTISHDALDHAQQLTMETGSLPEPLDYDTVVNPLAGE